MTKGVVILDILWTEWTKTLDYASFSIQRIMDDSFRQPSDQRYPIKVNIRRNSFEREIQNYNVCLFRFNRHA